MPYKRGDVILIPFPFSDLSSSKQRPALVISSEEFHRQCPDIIACAITSQSPTSLASFEYLLSKDDLSQAGLPKLSKVNCGKIVTLDRRIIRKKLGKLPASTLSEILSLIHKIV
jgi:mRNA interferase MazF